MHPAYGAPVKKTASTRLRQYNVEPPRLPLEITSTQAVSQTVMMYRSVQPCWYTSGTPPQPHLSSNQRPFTKIPGTTHKNYSVQDIILPTSHTPLEPTTWKCGGSRHPRQLQALSCLGQLSSKFATVFILLTCTVHRCHPHGHPKVWECTMSIPGRRRRIVLLRDFSKGSLLRVILQEP